MIMNKFTGTLKIRDEIERRKKILIAHSYNNSFPMESVERVRIQSLLEHGESPTRPTDVPTLMKQFCVSSFSYAPLRKYLMSITGDIPMRDTIQRTLSIVFENTEFLNDSNWTPESLGTLSLTIQVKNNYDLSRKQFKPSVMLI
jgi:hypothetical protein